MRKLKWFLALASMMALSDGSKPLVAQDVGYYDFCYHKGEVYQGGNGWHVIHCVNLTTKEELFIYQPI